MEQDKSLIDIIISINKPIGQILKNNRFRLKLNRTDHDQAKRNKS